MNGLIFPLLLLQVSSITAYGDKETLRPTDQKMFGSSVKKGSSADLLAMNQQKRQTLADLIAMDQKKQTLADLIAMERSEENEKLWVQQQQKKALAELIEKDQSIGEAELDEFVGEMTENERLLEKMFQTESDVQRTKEKGIIQKILKVFGKKKEKRKWLEEKYETLNTIKEKDPAMSQIMEKLQLYSKEIKSGKISEPLKQYLLIVIYILAKRQRIPISEIVPVKNMSKKKILAELVKMILEENRKNRQKNGQRGDKNGQKGDKNGQNDNKNGQNDNKNRQNENKSGQNSGNWERFKPNSAREERMLRLLLTAVDNLSDGTGIAQLALGGIEQSNRKRRRKRIAHALIAPLFLLFVCVLTTLLVTMVVTSEEWTGKLKANIARRKIVKALHQMPQQNVTEPTGEECAICLNPFEMEQKVRQIPPCQHKFHSDCIDKWARQHNNCPICRAKIFKISRGKAEPNEQNEGEEAADTN